MHGLPHVIWLWLSLHGFRYTCLSCLHSPVTRACHVDLSLLHMHVILPCDTCLYDFFILVIWIPISITCIIVPCYRIHVIWLLPVTDMDFLLLDVRAVDMQYVESHIYCSCFPLYCSHFPLYCSMLSTELRSSYHVTHIMYCNCSCYIVYLTYVTPRSRRVRRRYCNVYTQVRNTLTYIR